MPLLNINCLAAYFGPLSCLPGARKAIFGSSSTQLVCALLTRLPSRCLELAQISESFAILIS